ncbi:MAG TPA: ArsC/Spx/MgsR family protein [Acidimicrobiales bacterium]|nr:ArsC/Spx/MgsR family protein [Acidimicrobiales bacterium]
MGDTTVYFNPSCSKCRVTASILDERAVPYEVVEYLVAPPDEVAVRRLLAMLGGDPAALVRQDDEGFAAAGYGVDDVADADGVVRVLLAHPELMQRPVVVRGHRALIARPPERVTELFE